MQDESPAFLSKRCETAPARKGMVCIWQNRKKSPVRLYDGKIKERPVNKKKLLRRTVTTVAMAVIFGMIACVTFLTLEPVISNLLYPEEKPDAVIFPEEQEEISPEDMLVEDAPTPSIQEAVESVILEDEQIQKILDEIVLDKTITPSFTMPFMSIPRF